MSFFERKDPFYEGWEFRGLYEMLIRCGFRMVFFIDFLFKSHSQSRVWILVWYLFLFLGTILSLSMSVSCISWTIIETHLCFTEYVGISMCKYRCTLYSLTPIIRWDGCSDSIVEGPGARLTAQRALRGTGYLRCLFTNSRLMLKKISIVNPILLTWESNLGSPDLQSNMLITKPTRQ